MSNQRPDPASAREPGERRPSRRMIAGLLFVVAVICAVTLLPFLGRGSELLVAPLVGLAATVVLISGIWFAVESVMRKDFGAGLPDDEEA